MKKLQQFYIMKFSSTRLDKFGYHLKRILGNSGYHIRDIRQNGELIALADNQALRTIRNIRYERNPNIMRYDPAILSDLYAQKKNLKKQFNDYAKRQISIINGKIDEMLFIPEYVSVVIDDISHGNLVDITKTDMILTKSQFKLWNAYDSIQEYDRLCEENGFLWGVTKVTPKTDDNCFRSNYQFCQAIDLTNDDDVAELWSATQSVANNNSTISWELKGAGKGQAGWYMSGGFYVEIAGNVVCNWSTDTRIKLYDGTSIAKGI